MGWHRHSLCVVLTVALYAWMPLSPAMAEGSEPAYHFSNMHKHPWFWDVLAASLVGWVVGMVKGFSGTKDWLERYWQNPSPLAVWALDFIVFVGVGAYFGTGIYNPSNLLAAIGAGLSWPLGLGSLATRNDRADEE